MPASAGQHGFNRLFEWVAVITGASLAVILGIDPRSLGIGALQLLRDAGFTSQAISAGLTIISLARGYGLWSNGNLPRAGPWIRGACSFVMFLFWLQAAYALVRFPLVAGFVPVLLSFVIGQAVGEFVSITRAVQDGFNRP